MCCGEDEGEVMAKIEGETVQVVAVHPGAQIRIGRYGVATPDNPVTVPADVAEQFEGRTDLAVVEAKPKKARKGEER